MFLGIDTSNYTTSAALYDSKTGAIAQERLMLPVTAGERGLRQSDAVFLHVKQLPGLLESLLARRTDITGIGVSSRPRDAEGSYMPCFLVGELAARSAGAALGVPVYEFSHQAGHIAAALLGIGEPGLAAAPFLAFHASGGTTECLMVRPGSDPPFLVDILGKTLDLNAGQIIDRVGVMLGLDFPAGSYLEELAARGSGHIPPKPVVKGRDCCFSGLENQCRSMLESGCDAGDIARYCQESVGMTLLGAAKACAEDHCGVPFIFAGGVVRNRRIKEIISREIPDARFAPGDLSSDNAAGVAVLASMRFDRGKTQC